MPGGRLCRAGCPGWVLPLVSGVEVVNDPA